MIYITGDTHGDFRKVAAFCDTVDSKKEDILIILGDAGVNYYGGSRDDALKYQLSTLPITLFCIHGNHEKRPADISTYKEKEWCGGKVYMEEEYPSLLFAKDGDVYDFKGKKSIVIGGAYSVDKFIRLSRGWNWWENEQPSDEIKRTVEKQLEERDWKVDIVLSHTCPFQYIPGEAFLPGIDQSSVDYSTEKWMDRIEEKLYYSHWYCGHYHINKSIERLRFLYEDFIELP